MEKITIYKSNLVYEQKHPWIITKGDIKASFKTRKEAEKYRNMIRRAYISGVSGSIMIGNEKI